jgi:thymidylate synthase (FAD)
MKVTFVDSMGSDLRVVNSARVSFDKQSELLFDCSCGQETFCGRTCVGRHSKLKDSDANLIRFLGRGMTTNDFNEFINDAVEAGDSYDNARTFSSDGDTIVAARKNLINLLYEWRRTPEHSSPFRHCYVHFKFKAPIFVARQLAKHQVGLSWSEISRRYVDSAPEFYWPDKWRAKSADKKQGSSDSETVAEPLYIRTAHEALVSYYSELLDDGVAPEQARMILPQNMYTEWEWSGSLLAFAFLYNTRTREDPQQECRDVVKQIGPHMERLFPVSWDALTGYGGK